MHGGDCGSQLNRPGIAVQQLGLRVRVEQRMVLVLAVQRDQAAAKFAQLAGVGWTAVDACGAALAELPLEYEGIASRLEDPLNGRPLSAMPDLICPTPTTNGEAEGVDNERLAAPCFASEQVQAGAEPHARLRDEGQVPDPELPQH